ncbi:MAG: ISAs1 family transposase [Candidatus Cloacimonetes bacterium]|nr:ISAs1 family transposase [Candidatus Cloacimonadota bacterium]
MQPFNAAFKNLRDPRSMRNRKHRFYDIIVLSILAVTAGAESYEDIERYGKEKIDFLKGYLSLDHGIPSHDTINRLFQAINPIVFQECFNAFTQQLVSNDNSRDIIPIDGKTSRGSRDTFSGKGPLHSVHAWSVENGICIAQQACDGKGNELGAIRDMLDYLIIENCIITIDALGTQTDIVEKIINKGGDYVLAVKENQPNLSKKVHSITENTTCVSDTTITEKNRGRIETRRAEVFKNIPCEIGNKWLGLETMIKITSTTEFPSGKTTFQERYYISSLDRDNDFNKIIRSHWQVENNLHWVLDMTFSEDDSRKRAKNAAANFSILRKIVLNLLKLDKGKGSLKGKRKTAGWSDNYMLTLLKLHVIPRLF